MPLTTELALKMSEQRSQNFGMAENAGFHQVEAPDVVVVKGGSRASVRSGLKIEE